jgi:hypothetical protein
MKEIEKERFLPDHDREPRVLNGTMLRLPSGRKVHQAFLNCQAEALIRLGPGAVPSLLPWVKSRCQHVRYIAIYSLEEITTLHPRIWHFDMHDPERYQERAITVWSSWHSCWIARNVNIVTLGFGSGIVPLEGIMTLTLIDSAGRHALR